MKRNRVLNHVRTHREASGLTQEELAYLITGRTSNAVKRHDRGESDPSFVASMAYEIAFRVSLVELFPEQHRTAEAAIRKRAAHLVENLSRDEFDDRTKQKIEFLGTIISAPDSHHNP